MQSIINLRKEVERHEKAAEEAKKQADECNLNLRAKMEELKLMEQRVTETNEMVCIFISVYGLFFAFCLYAKYFFLQQIRILHTFVNNL